MFSLSASSFVGTSVSASFKGTGDAFVAMVARRSFSRRRFFFVREMWKVRSEEGVKFEEIHARCFRLRANTERR